jgi:hypothetical protein
MRIEGQVRRKKHVYDPRILNLSSPIKTQSLIDPSSQYRSRVHHLARFPGSSPPHPLPLLLPFLYPYLGLAARLLEASAHALIAFDTTDQGLRDAVHGFVRVPSDRRARLFRGGGRRHSYPSSITRSTTCHGYGVYAATTTNIGYWLMDASACGDTRTRGGSECVGGA